MGLEPRALNPEENAYVNALEAFIEVNRLLLGLDEQQAFNLTAWVLGDQSGCWDDSAYDDPLLRSDLIQKGHNPVSFMRDMILRNYQLGYDAHKAKHDKLREMGSSFLNKVCESHKEHK